MSVYNNSQSHNLIEFKQIELNSVRNWIKMKKGQNKNKNDAKQSFFIQPRVYYIAIVIYKPILTNCN
jgi:hypothetical protein